MADFVPTWVHKKERFKVILKFTNDLIEDILDNSLSEEEIEYKLNAILMENGKSLFIRLVRVALGNPTVKTQLRANQNGVFILTCEKWQKIMDGIDKEELEVILTQSLELS